MNNKDFREEIKGYMDNCYDRFSNYQQIAMEILVEFDRVCGINNLDYYLGYGSMIGAIRDNNQIPWDYDIDTLVKVDDRERLISVLDKDLSDDFYYDYSNKNPSYPTSCLRICKKGYSMMALHVDVFFLIGTPNNENRRKHFIYSLIRVMKLRTEKNLTLFIPTKSRIVKIKSLLLKLLLPNVFLKYTENCLFYRFQLKEARFWCTNQTVYKKVYPKDIFASTIKVKVKDHYFSVPAGYEDFLTINYGDWRSYLPIKKRFDEFYKMLNNVEKRQSIYEQQSGK